MIGERINNYEIVSVLGEGGMGSVFLAEHPFMGRKAAIKVLRGDLAHDSGLVERFAIESTPDGVRISIKDSYHSELRTGNQSDDGRSTRGR